MSGEITVFLVSLGKFRIVTQGHLLVWKQIVEVARDILNNLTIGQRVNVCIEISSSISRKCPPDGGMKGAIIREKCPNIKDGQIENIHSSVARTTQSRLMEQPTVVHVGMTRDMKTAQRMIAVRCCESCELDISDRPANNTLCLDCWRDRHRQCQFCELDISDRPANHTLCLDCWNTVWRHAF